MTTREGPWVERVLARLGSSLADAEKRRALLDRWMRWARLSARVLVCGYCAFLVVLWAAMRWRGEANLTFAFLLFLPPSLWVLPLAPLGLLALLLDWRSLVICAVAAVIVIWGLMGLAINGKKTAKSGAPILTVLSYNRGEHSNTSLQPFKNLVKPDVIALQVAPSRAGRYLASPGYEEFSHGDAIGEFTIISRYPVTGKELILFRDSGNREKAIAAKFTLDFAGTPVAVYSAHLPTPREPLMVLRRGAFLWGILGPFSASWAAKRDSYETFWLKHVEAAELIIRRAEAETIPCLVVGDFNAPAHGRIHHRLSRQFTDSHESAGSGFGYTFPGVTRNPLSLGGPWMRIDKLLAGPGWQPIWSLAEEDRPSQHRAIAAQFALER